MASVAEAGAAAGAASMAAGVGPTVGVAGRAGAVSALGGSASPSATGADAIAGADGGDTGMGPVTAGAGARGASARGVGAAGTARDWTGDGWAATAERGATSGALGAGATSGALGAGAAGAGRASAASRAGASPGPNTRRFTFSTTTCFVRPWEKLCRTVPCSTGRFSDSVVFGLTVKVFSPTLFGSLISHSSQGRVRAQNLRAPKPIFGKSLAQSSEDRAEPAASACGLPRYRSSRRARDTNPSPAVPPATAACITFVRPNAKSN